MEWLDLLLLLFLIKKIIYLFVIIFGCSGSLSRHTGLSVAVQAFSSCGKWRRLTHWDSHGLLIVGLLGGAWALGTRASLLWCHSLVALQLRDLSWDLRAPGTELRVPCFVRRTPSHWTTKEALLMF